MLLRSQIVDLCYLTLFDRAGSHSELIALRSYE
jgi:hypothetical protein